jgi:CDP-diglyceride synthetase
MIIRINRYSLIIRRIVTGIVLLLVVPAAICWLPSWLFTLAIAALFLLLLWDELPRILCSRSFDTTSFHSVTQDERLKGALGKINKKESNPLTLSEIPQEFCIEGSGRAEKVFDKNKWRLITCVENQLTRIFSLKNLNGSSKPLALSEIPQEFCIEGWRIKNIFIFLIKSCCYVGFPLLLLILLQADPQYYLLALLAVLTVSANDIGAYFVGTWIGKRKMCPTISPGKTWEGFWGGWGLVIGVLIIWKLLRGAQISWWIIPFLGLWISVLATLGDLYESWLKRRAGIKDSGTLLPGHGGILDRIDSLLFVIIFFYFAREQLALLLL